MGIDEIGDKDLIDHAKAGLKKGGIKAIAKGGATALTAGGTAVVGGAALPAVGAAALVGAAAGFGAGAAKSVGMERLKDYNRDYTTMEGITNEAPKDIGNLADNIGDFIGSAGGNADTAETTHGPEDYADSRDNRFEGDDEVLEPNEEELETE
ncbi:hypothetical protein [Halorubellus sp. PRR65]|uniref:hypothetical protein n=1 Tax=Halorubellus sp. PRR65 TaxID=3098148 RepID=UPI002B258ABD|nr:hypothetical protein [Halorubellus sp. PRR65]